LHHAKLGVDAGDRGGSTVTHRVRVEPWGIDLEVVEGETLFDAAFRQGWRWPTNCYGQLRCTVCHMKVLEGSEHLSEDTPGERAIIERLLALAYRIDPDAELRLACCARVIGAAVVEIRRPLRSVIDVP
jgi:2Fe-2S ferredoxin